MIEIILGVVLFTAIILCLVGVILYARARLVKAGPVRIDINDDPDRRLQVEAGQTLLTTLSEQDIFLSSACGGSGTCGLCKVKLLAGGGQALPTEQGLLSKKQIKEGYRLACQLHVNQDLRLELPPEVLEIKKLSCEVLSNECVATFIKEPILRLPQGEPFDFRPGSYIQVEAPPHRLKYSDIDIAERYRPTWDKLGLWQLESVVEQPLQRAYSLANYPGEQGGLKLNVRIATPPPGKTDLPPGKVSSYMYGLRPGDRVNVSGPFGSFFPQEGDSEMIYIGGGAGMAPLRAHLMYLLRSQGSGRKISYWYGARSLCEAFYLRDFDDLARDFPNFQWRLALSEPQPEDEWKGLTGFIHQILFDEYLKEHPAPEECEYYICGPPVMLRSAVTMLHDLGVDDDNILFDDFGG